MVNSFFVEGYGLLFLLFLIFTFCISLIYLGASVNSILLFQVNYFYSKFGLICFSNDLPIEFSFILSTDFTIR